MAYIANHYVNLDGKVYIPGEVITEQIDADKEEWLLGKGAIRKKVASDSFFDDAEDEQAQATVTDQGDKDGKNDEDSSEDDAEGTEDTEDSEDNTEDSKDAEDTEDSEDNTEDSEDAEDAEDEEEYEDVEPPEIDVADSIVAPAEEPAAEDKKPARKRKGGKEKA